ncbi:serine/threonine-protein kinase [Bradyrhizobium elkanii]|uniref:serine/threonine-protein kinase n=1 Tax=Bradyrhizobium elkanii TaxID=29448 RepID=UPI000570F4EE|nr:serine/threonine-protein kinase [Bradyrhizobium elkanii]
MGSYAAGDVLCDEYVVRLPLGRGGMGAVYLVEHANSGELRAAKVMRVRDNATAADLVDFRQEALSLLNVGVHPMIVKLFDVREQGAEIVLLMEYVAPASGCTTLHDFIVRKQDYNDRLLGAWAVEFCVGMEHALACGMAAHRDIKPANLLWGSGPWLKIADFGLALAVSRHPALIDGSPKKPSQLQWMKSADGRATCGTPGYVSPELFFGGKASPQSDMFSFGVTLWQLAARSLDSPYEVGVRGDVAEYQRAILERALAHQVSRIDSPFFDVIRRCLAPDPARRYPDFSALREAVKSAAKAVGIPAIDFVVGPGFKGSFDDYVNRGRSYLVLGRYERALSILDQAVKHNPSSYPAQVARAEALVHRGEYMAAVRAYETAHEIEPEAFAPFTGMAYAWLALDLPERARASLDKVLARQPKNLEALLLLAHVFGAAGDNVAALSVVETVVAMDPQDWRAHEYHGRALSSLGKLIDAVGAYARCLRINPLALTAALDLASVLNAQKDLVAAGKEYERAIRLFRDNAEALNRIAAHMAERGHERRAIELFQELADIVPESKSILMVNIGNAQLRLGDIRSAVAAYRKAIETDPDNALAYCRLGDIESEAGRHEKAAECFVRACELESDNPRYHSLAGTAYLQENNYRLAAAYLRRSIELFPEQPLMLYNLAVSLFFDGEKELALEQVANAVRLDEGYARGWYLKALIEAEIGRIEDATASARRAAANGSALSDHDLEKVYDLIKELSGNTRAAPEEAPPR